MKISNRYAVAISLPAVVVAFTSLSAGSVLADPDPTVAKIDDCLEGTLQAARTTPEKRVEACSAAIQSRKLSPEDVALARLNRAVARVAMGDKGMANTDYEEALKHYDTLIDSNKIDALDALGQTDRALADYNEATRLGPQNAEAFFERGLLLATRKREFGRALADFDRVLALQPDDVAALILRADASRQMGNLASAMADVDRALALEPDNPRAYFARGLLNSRRGEKRQALADYDEALRLYPTYADALVSRSAIYAGDGQVDLALVDLDAAIAVQTDNPIAFYNRGYAHFAKKRYDLALADYDTAIVLDPNMGAAYGNRCLVRAITGDDQAAALVDCDTALKLMPTNPDVRETRGFIYLKLGEPMIAILEYNAALAADSNRTLALYGRGMAKIKAGQQADGERDQAAARALDPAVSTQFSMYGLK